MIEISYKMRIAKDDKESFFENEKKRRILFQTYQKNQLYAVDVSRSKVFGRCHIEHRDQHLLEVGLMLH